MSERIEEWSKWVEHGPIFRDVAAMNYRRRLFRGFINGIWSRFIGQDRQSRVDMSWVVHYQAAYWTQQAIAVRRQTEPNEQHKKPVVTLRRLFDEVAAHPESVGVDHFLSVSGNADSDEARLTFARLFGAAPDGEPLEKSLDRTTLNLRQWKRTRKGFITAAEPVRTRVSKSLAHADEVVMTAEGPIHELLPLSYDQLHLAIQRITSAFGKAYLLLVGAETDLSDIRVGGDYRAPFRTAIFSNEFDVLPAVLGPFHDETEDQRLP